MPQPVQQRYLLPLKERFPAAKIDIVDRHEDASPFTAATEVLITHGSMIEDHVVRTAPKLRWIQALGSGVDGILNLPSLREDILVTNMHGVHGAAVSEAVICALLSLSRDVPRSGRAQERHSWDRFPSNLLDGKTIGIVGIGHISEVLAPKCKALGMRVIGVTSTIREVNGFDVVFGRAELSSVASQADYLIVLTPSTSATYHIINADVIAAMRPSSYLINFARGDVIDELALIDALRETHLAGAALDVFDTEPLPVDHPFWSMPNVIVTAHLAGLHDEYPERALPTIITNMERFLQGDHRSMINVVVR